MRLFFIKLCIFAAPLLGGWLFVEWQLSRLPNPYTKKRELVERKGASTKVLVLGSSLEFEDIAPSEFACAGLNMANPAQSVFLDAEVVRRYLSHLPELRLVIQGVSYGSFECQLSDSYLNSAVFLSHHYLGTGLDGGASFWDLKNFSLIAAYGQEVVIEQLRSGFTTDMMSQTIDDFGWNPVGNGTVDPVSAPIAEWGVKELHRYMKTEHIPENLQAMEQMITLLQKHNVQVALVSSPVVPSVVQYLDPVRLERTHQIIASLQARFGVTYNDYLTDPRFIVPEDFHDPDHLNNRGAEKYSRILNEEIIEPRGICGTSPHRPEPH